MNKAAVIFPGQASQYVGMGKDLYEASADVRKLYELASDEIGENIARLSFEGPSEKLTETRFTQPAILLHSLAVLRILGENMPPAAVTAGHSLGEYGSLVLAGILDFETAVRAVVKRSALMEAACRENPGTMAAIMGLAEDKIAEVCRMAQAAGVVVPANFNSSIQTVISGSRSGVEEACRLSKEVGAKKAVMLNVGGAFHSPLMEPARTGMAEYLENIEFGSAEIPVVPNVTGTAEKSPSRLKELLVEQLTSPVRWYDTTCYFRDEAIDACLEIGPGKVLTGLAKRELRQTRLHNIDTLEDIEKFSAVIAG